MYVTTAKKVFVAYNIFKGTLNDFMQNYQKVLQTQTFLGIYI